MAADAPLFLTGSLLRHVTTMSLTASIGLMAMFAVDFVNVVFIAMIGNAELAAAIGYAGTVLFFTTSIGIGLSIAAGSLTAQAVGRGHPEDARGYATTAVVLGVLVGIALPLLLLPPMPWILGALGAEGEVARLAQRFLTVVLPSMPVLAVAMTAMAVLRAHGDARRAMTAPLFAGVVNAVLDPLLIFGLNLGLDGAAIATVLSRLALLAATLYPALTVHHGFMRPSLARLRSDLSPAAAIAVPAVLANIATPVGNAIVTREVARFGTEAVAGFAVIGRLTPLAFAVVFALSGAIGPIIGQNFGAGRHDRVRAAYNAAVVFTAVYVVIATLVLFLLREPISRLFEAEGETRRLILLFCGPLALASFFNGVIFVANASFNNLGHPSYSTVINWGRHTLGTWPFAVAGAALWGAAGALVGQAVGGVIFAALASWLAFRVMERRPATLPGPFAHQARWQSLFARHK